MGYIERQHEARELFRLLMPANNVNLFLQQININEHLEPQGTHTLIINLTDFERFNWYISFDYHEHEKRTRIYETFDNINPAIIFQRVGNTWERVQAIDFLIKYLRDNIL